MKKIIKVAFWGPALIIVAMTMKEDYQDERFFDEMLVLIFGLVGLVALALLIFVVCEFAPIFSVLGVGGYFLLRKEILSYLDKRVFFG